MSDNEKTSYQVRGEDLLNKVRELIHEGNLRRLLIKSESGEVYLRIPVTVGIIGALLLPMLAAVGALAAIAGVFIVEIEHRSSGETKARSTTKKKSR